MDSIDIQNFLRISGGTGKTTRMLETLSDNNIILTTTREKAKLLYDLIKRDGLEPFNLSFMTLEDFVKKFGMYKILPDSIRTRIVIDHEVYDSIIKKLLGE